MGATLIPKGLNPSRLDLKSTACFVAQYISVWILLFCGSGTNIDDMT
jgi:hypothetical protein